MLSKNNRFILIDFLILFMRQARKENFQFTNCKAFGQFCREKPEKLNQGVQTYSTKWSPLTTLRHAGRFPRRA